jgi:hypothetical protein
MFSAGGLERSTSGSGFDSDSDIDVFSLIRAAPQREAFQHEAAVFDVN